MRMCAENTRIQNCRDQYDEDGLDAARNRRDLKSAQDTSARNAEVDSPACGQHSVSQVAWSLSQTWVENQTTASRCTG